jgi:hypothetical protein
VTIATQILHTGTMSARGHLLPIVVRKTRQLITQKPPITERNVTPAEVPQKAAERGSAALGHFETFDSPVACLKLRPVSSVLLTNLSAQVKRPH